MPQKMFRLTDEQICKLKKVSELRGCSQTDLIRGFIDFHVDMTEPRAD